MVDTNPFKHGDRVQLTKESRESATRAALQGAAVPDYIFGRGIVIDTPETTLHGTLSAIVTGIDLLVSWDDDPEPDTNPTVLVSDMVELCDEQ